jgi:hypothetical protein
MNTRLALAAAAVGAALLGGTAPPADADTGSDLDPLALLYGDTGFNSWTTAADTDLAALSPTLTADLTTSVDDFHLAADDPISLDLYSLDPSAFSADPLLGGLPDNGIGDLAVSLDYADYSVGADLSQLFDLGWLSNLLGDWSVGIF